MLFGYDFTLIAIILLIGIVKKNGIMMSYAMVAGLIESQALSCSRRR